jgi:hypothetical protein
MLKLNWIFSLLSFFMLSIDGEGGGGEVDDLEVDDEEVESPEDAVLDELGFGDDSEEKDEPAVDVDPEANPEEVVASEAELEAEKQKLEQEKGKITDEDLAPLNSKNASTNERFQKITEGYKQEKERADQLEGRVKQYEGSINSLRELGFGDEQSAHDLVNFSGYRNALYAGDAETFSKIVSEQIRLFEAEHGKRVRINASLLDEHADLVERVNSLDLDENTAFEVARARNLESRATRDRQNQQQYSQQQQNNQQLLNESISAVEQLQANWQKTDPDYQKIVGHLQGQMEEIGKNYPPQFWPQLLDTQYKILKKALADSAPRPAGNLLRGNSSGMATPVANSPEEAVLQSMGFN